MLRLRRVGVVEAAHVHELDPVSGSREPDLRAAGPDVSARVSFEDFFAAEYRRIVGIAVVLCGRRGVAEELAQDAFVAAFRHWHRISQYDDPSAWVRRVVTNLATSSLRRRSREARALVRISRRRESTVELTAGDDEFWKAVRSLPRRQAQCVTLRYLEDRSVVEIAAVLGIAEATVRVHLHDARAALAIRLKDDLDEEVT
jgi:RNA polymerase sigma-70 factor (ECF subfamily)